VSKKLAEIAVGDFVLRWFVGIPKPMRFKVTQLTADRIICGGWEFDRRTGAEIDEYLGWGPGGVTGSFLEPESGTDPEEDFRSGAMQRLAALLDAGKMQRNRGESIAEAMRRRLNGMTEEQVSRLLYELESGEPS
jgi:hypothetical protein